MSTDLNIVIGANVDRARSALSSFGKATQDLHQQIMGLKYGIDIMSSVFQTAFVFGKQGAELEMVRGQLDSLAISIGTTSDALIDKMSAATGGLMSNAEMISSATQIISLGLANNETDVVRLATVVSELGWDMQQVILTFANNSTMRLDALGLSVEDVTNRAMALEDQGITADIAFDMAVLDAAEAKIKIIGSQANTAAGDFKRFEAASKDAGDALKLFFLPLLQASVDGFLSFTEGSKSVKDAIAEHAESLYDAGLSWEEMIEQMGAGAPILELVNFLTGGQAEKTWDLSLAQWELIKGTTELTEEEKRLAEQAESSDRAMLGYAGSLAGVAEETEEVKSATSEAKTAVELLTQSYNPLKTQLGLVEDAIGLMTDSMIEAERMKLALRILTEDLTGLSEKEKEAHYAELIALQANLELMQELNDHYEAGTISKEDWYAIIADGVVTVEELNTALGLTDENLQDVEESLWNSKQAMGENIPVADDLSDSLYGAAGGAGSLYTNLQKLDGLQTFSSHTHTIYTKGGGSGGGGGIIVEPEEEDPPDIPLNDPPYVPPTDRPWHGHFGADFVVPPGFAGDSFGPMWAESGERVQVTSAADMQAGRGGHGGGETNIIVMLDGREIAAHVQSMSGRDLRRARNSGAGLTGI